MSYFKNEIVHDPFSGIERKYLIVKDNCFVDESGFHVSHSSHGSDHGSHGSYDHNHTAHDSHSAHQSHSSGGK